MANRPKLPTRLRCLLPARRACFAPGILARAGAVLATIVLLIAVTSCLSAADPRRVLLLHAFGHPYSPWSDIAGSFRSELVRKSPSPIDLYEVSLDTAQVQDPKGEMPFVEYIRALFAGRKLDLIVPVGAPAAFFMQRHRSVLLPATPMLIVGADLRRVPPADLGQNETAVLFDLDLAAYFKNILALLPNTNEVAVVTGNSPVERFWAAELHRDTAPLAEQLNITWFNDLTFGEMLARAGAMPPHSAIFYGLLSEDAAGVTYPQDVALDRLRAATNAPLFGTGDYELGRGIVGGPLLQTRGLGREAAEVGLRILAGEKPGDIHVPTVPFGTPMYDWRELRRWAISESRLPTSSIVQYREPTVWEQYRWGIVAIVVILVAQTALITCVLWQSRRRRAAEASLKESEQRMTSTAATVNVGLWQFNRETNELWATGHCRALFGLGRDRPLTRDTLLAAIHPHDRVGAIAWFRVAASSMTPSDFTDFRVAGPDGRVRWLRVRANVGDLRAPNQLGGVFIDVTEQKAAEAEAAERLREVTHLTRVSVLGELSGAIAHEINQPLTAILSNAQAALHLLAQKSPNLAEVRDAIDDIVHENNRASDVIRRLRDLLKKGEREFDLVDLNDLVKSTVALLNSELVARRIEVECDLASGLPAASGDSVQLQQVLLNLFMNAMDAMASAPGAMRRITASTRATQSGTIEIRVRDRGAGLRPGEEDLAFKPFYTSKDHGLGLGLAICSTIAEAHAGTLALTNHKERGALAVLSLPVRSAVPVAAK